MPKGGAGKMRVPVVGARGRGVYVPVRVGGRKPRVKVKPRKRAPARKKVTARKRGKK